MNPDTLVVVHTYQGDAHQVQAALPQYLHHDAPVLVLSPADSPVEVEGVECRSAGERAYTGEVSVRRQREHLGILLDYPAAFYLLHDADSVCLSPELPAYLYEQPEMVFYNASPTARFLARAVRDPGERHPWAERFPVVYQPPLFFSRASLEAMLAVSDRAIAALPPFAQLIDWYFEAMCQEAGLVTRAFPDGVSRPIWHPYEIARVYAMVRLHGYVFLHSVKAKEALEVFVAGHAEWEADKDGALLCEWW